MFSDDSLEVARERGRRLWAEAAAERLRAPSRTRHVLAAFLRRAADRLDPASSLVRKPALR